MESRHDRRDRWVYASNSYANIAPALVGTCLGLAAAGVGAFVSPSMVLSTLALCAAWNVFLVCRARISNRQWVLAVSSSKLLVRMFTPGAGPFDRRTPANVVGAECDVLELLRSDVSDWYQGSVEIVWSKLRRTTVEWLIVECDPSLEVAILATRLESGGSRCESGERWFVAWENGRLLIRWTLRPELGAFLADLRLFRPMSGHRRIVIDVTQFAHLTEEAQRELIGRLTRLGFGSACLMILRRHKHMSVSQAASYVNTSWASAESWSE